MKKISRVVVLLFACVSGFLYSSQEIGVELDKYMQVIAEKKRFIGTVVVGDQNSVYLNAGYGYANYEHDISNSSKTMFRAASVTKMVVATAILQLQEKKLLSVDDTMNKYIPTFPRGSEISIHQLLSHTSGIANGPVPPEILTVPASLDKLVRLTEDNPLAFEPGSNYCYCNGNYVLLAKILEVVSGEPYNTFIMTHVLRPSGIEDEGFYSAYAIIKNAASPYQSFIFDDTYYNAPYIFDRNAKGCGDLICTAHDLYLFIKALDNGVLLTEDSLRLMRTIHNNNDKEHYGYGCCLTTHDGQEVVQHEGITPNGFNSLVMTLLHKKIYVVLMGNIRWNGGETGSKIIQSMVAIVQGKEYESSDSIKGPETGCQLM